MGFRLFNYLFSVANCQTPVQSKSAAFYDFLDIAIYKIPSGI